MAKTSYISLLKNRGFSAFLGTQFLGAFNDNIYKTVIQLLVLIEIADQTKQELYVALAGIVFIIPNLLFSGYAGFFADVYSKRRVLMITKSLEIAAMCLAFYAFRFSNPEILLFVLFIMATQSVFFSPAKYGIVPEILPETALSLANGLLELTTFVAIIFGVAIASKLIDVWSSQLDYVSLVLIFIALVGTACSFGITRVPPSGATKTWRLNPWHEVAGGIRRLKEDRVLLLTVLAISYFWGLGMAVQINLLLYSERILQLSVLQIGLTNALLGVGIGVGSIIAGWLSGERIELGLVPLGAVGIVLCTFGLGFSGGSVTLSWILLFIVGVASGLYIVPLNALLQERPAAQEKGRLLATNNFLNGVGMLLAGGFTWVLLQLSFAPNHVFLFIAGLTLIGTIYTLKILPLFFIRLVLWMITHTIYRVRVLGESFIPHRGPALIISNHVSFVDGLIIGLAVPRQVRFFVDKAYYDHRAFNWLLRLTKAIPVQGGNPKQVQEAIAMARQSLIDGHIVCIFAEGRLTRTGNLLPFKSGFEKIIDGLDVPIIPVHLDQLWHSIFAHKGGKVVWKWPQRLPVPVTLSLGEPLPSTTKAAEIRQAVQYLGSEAAAYSHSLQDTLPKKLLQIARKKALTRSVADINTKPIRYLTFVAKALTLSRYLKQHYPTHNTVFILLAPSVGAALINVALTIAGKQVVNLPLSTNAAEINSLLNHCDTDLIITDAEFKQQLQRADYLRVLDINELCTSISRFKTLFAALSICFLPNFLTLKFYGSDKALTDAAFVVFSRATHGNARAIVLSQRSVLANVSGLGQILSLNAEDAISSSLSFSSAFGLSNVLWAPLLLGMRILFNNEPSNFDRYGRLLRQQKITLLVDHTLQIQCYTDALRPDVLSYLKYAIAGGEAVSEDLFLKFKDKFDIDLLSGYGCSEMGPTISLNVPSVRATGQLQRGSKRGSVGQILPGVGAKIVDDATGANLSIDQMGTLWVSGLGRMVGYLDKSIDVENILVNGWFNTGDKACIDSDGFLFIAQD